MPLNTSKIFPPLPEVLHDRASYEALRLSEKDPLSDPCLTGHPGTVRSIAQDGVPVVEVHNDPVDLGRCGQLLTQPFIFFAPPRTGMSADLVLPQLLDMASKAKS